MEFASYFYNQEDQTVTDPREQAFHNTIREYVIVCLILLILYGFSYLLISWYRRRRDDLQVDFVPLSSSDLEDAIVYRVSLWMCTFSLAISMGAALLLPFSVVTNEVLIIYPDNYYMQWLNDGLVQSLWNNVFVFSNISLFLLLPPYQIMDDLDGNNNNKDSVSERLGSTRRGRPARTEDSFLSAHFSLLLTSYAGFK